MARYATLLSLLPVLVSLWLTTGCAQYATAQGTVDARIQHAAEVYLADHFPGDAARLEVRVVRASGELPVSKQLTVEFPSTTALPRAHTQVAIASSDASGGTRKVGHAMLYVAHFDSVVVAQSRIPPDGVLSERDLTIAWMETTRTYGAPLRAADYRQMLITGPVHAKRLIREGQALRASDVRAAYAVETGSQVLMTYDRGRIMLKLSCAAREPGGIGDVIRVYSSSTSTTYKARLTGPGTAEWIETL